MNTCPVCGGHIRDGVTCPNCGPVTKDEKETRPKGGKKKTCEKDKGQK